ncbi:hypothetical protein SISNIDRAFT_354675 [Sistotremastrum niveocremeum HHB9708]|uniref:Uncharacterized protein n=1 Tax=Sistotremastrum niveocremeum HHB9708 TaxID=1314777 RepID=A0A164MF04_9AGAM|nr:hypothetical protein SISNIDRAFT_354675 [Sistotremastrum niveocremeum HHB9708]
MHREIPYANGIVLRPYNAPTAETGCPAEQHIREESLTVVLRLLNNFILIQSIPKYPIEFMRGKHERLGEKPEFGCGLYSVPEERFKAKTTLNAVKSSLHGDSTRSPTEQECRKRLKQRSAGVHLRSPMFPMLHPLDSGFLLRPPALLWLEGLLLELLDD